MNFEKPAQAEEENAEKYFQEMIQEVKNLTGGKTVEHQEWANIVRTLGETPCKIHIKRMGKNCRTCTELNKKTQAILKIKFSTTSRRSGFRNIMDDTGIPESEYLEKNKLVHMNKLLKENVLSSDFFREKLLKCYTAEEIFKINRRHFDTLYPWKNERRGIPSNFHCCVMKLGMINTDFETVNRLISKQSSETEQIMKEIENEHFSGNRDMGLGKHEVSVEDLVLGIIYLRLTLRFQKALKIFLKFLKLDWDVEWGEGEVTPIRELVKALLQNSSLFGLRLYRYPLVLERKIKVTLERLEEEEESKREAEGESGRFRDSRRRVSKKIKKKHKSKKKKKDKGKKKKKKKKYSRSRNSSYDRSPNN